jgi:adenine phosphoribosyltransferase
VLATGGTAAAASGLIEDVGGRVVGCSFLLTIAVLHGIDRLQGREVRSLLSV